MAWEVIEKVTDEGGIKEWAVFLRLKGFSLDEGARPYARGWWFYGRDEAGDPEGKRRYEEGLNSAREEAARLNRLLGSYPKSDR